MLPSERNVLPKIGATFFRDELAMFQFVVDARNVIGPRPATKADIEKYPAEWGAFVAAEAAEAKAEALAMEWRDLEASGSFVVTQDGAAFPTIAEAANHAAELEVEPRQKRAYTRRSRAA